MTFNERVQAGKPYLTGFILGIIAAPIIGFSAGWVSTTGARTEAVENARIDTLASVCSQAAQSTWASESLDLAALKGWDNRAKREELVASTMATLSVPEDLTRKVANACNRTLA